MEENIFPQLQRELGSLDARLATLETLMSDVRDALKQLAANETRLSHLERDRIQHEKRIAELESRSHEWSSLCDSIMNHIKNDKSVDIVAGEWALRILMLTGGAFALWLFERLPKILDVLK